PDPVRGRDRADPRARAAPGAQGADDACALQDPERGPDLLLSTCVASRAHDLADRDDPARPGEPTRRPVHLLHDIPRRMALFDQELVREAVAGRVEEDAVGRGAVPTCAAGLLVV